MPFRNTINTVVIVPDGVGSAKSVNKLSLVGMQLPEKFKENFDVSSEVPSSGVTGTKGLRSKRRNSSYIFQVVTSLPTKAYKYCVLHGANGPFPL